MYSRNEVFYRKNNSLWLISLTILLIASTISEMNLAKNKVV